MVNTRLQNFLVSTKLTAKFELSCMFDISENSFVAQKLLFEAKAALSCLQHQKLLKTSNVAKKMPSAIYKGLVLEADCEM